MGLAGLRRSGTRTTGSVSDKATLLAKPGALRWVVANGAQVAPSAALVVELARPRRSGPRTLPRPILQRSRVHFDGLLPIGHMWHRVPRW